MILGFIVLHAWFSIHDFMVLRFSCLGFIVLVFIV